MATEIRKFEKGIFLAFVALDKFFKQKLAFFGKN
jgi:hypothetical protein